ncbi:MAG: glycosyltransferase family 39 protein [Nitrospiraceae bacterium]|nr:glycosyltransferase family 39 protein [Nitrospiraceae bacterium]
MNISDIDKSLFFFINHGTSNALFDVVMPFITAKSYLLLLPYLIYILYTAYIRQKADFNVRVVLWSFFLAVLAFLLSDWLGNEVKHLIERVRPCNAFGGARLLVGCSQSYSMPSNHATNFFAAAVVLFYFARNRVPVLLSIYPLILAALVAFSRVYVGVHYPSDISVGAFLGSAIGFLVIGLYKYASSRYEVRPYTTLLFSFLLVISVFRIYYILHGPLDLSPDEAHYWEWSRRLDLSYYSKGPMIAYLIYIGTSIFGDNVFGIRIMAVIFSALSSIYVFKLVNLMYAEQENEVRSQPAALASALLLQVIPLFTPFGVIFSIDSPFIFFWILSLYFFWKAIASEHRIQNAEQRLGVSNSKLRTPNSELQVWLFLGISIGLGLLTKYTMSFFYICSFLFLIFSEKRFLLRGLKPYTALLISILIFSPVIIWNFQHDWVTIRHTAGQAHVSEGIKISLKTFFEFLGSQIGIITPILFVMMLYALFKMQKLDHIIRAKFLFWFSIPVIAFFLLKSLQGKVQPNWAMTGYITGIIAFAGYFLSKANDTSRITRYFVLAGIGLALFVSVISHYPSILNLPPKTDPTSRLRGWKELGAEVSMIYNNISEKGHVFIFSDRYQVSSELAFYVKGHPRTYCINLGRRMNQYDLWPDMNSDAVKIRQNKGSANNINAIFVRIDNTDMPSGVAEAFEGFEKKLLQVYDKKGYLVREYSIFICYNFKGLKTASPETY